jgi:hypothetical protein
MLYDTFIDMLREKKGKRKYELAGFWATLNMQNLLNLANLLLEMLLNRLDEMLGAIHK